MKNTTLGLSMIMKNESHVILRCLKSILPIIDYWVIVDTGSTDGSQEIVKNFFKENNVPGQLIEIEWKDFSTSRNVALNALEPHVDYGMWIDCDEELIIDKNFNKETLLSTPIDSIYIKTIYNKINYTRKNIWKTNKQFKWDGPIHEILSSPNEQPGTVATNLHVIVRPEGSSWKNIKQKYLDHANILEKYTLVNSDPRWIFYTAQSYRDASEYEKSIEWYEKRASIDKGFLEEIYSSKYMIAKLSEAIGKDKNYCTGKYQEAHASDPIKGEAMKSLIQMYHRSNDFENAYIFSLYSLRYNKQNPYPKRILFLDTHLYDYEMLELHAVSCYYTKRYEEGSKIYWLMRSQIDKLPKDYLTLEQQIRIDNNEQFYPKPITKISGPNYTKPKKKRKK